MRKNRFGNLTILPSQDRSNIAPENKKITAMIIRQIKKFLSVENKNNKVITDIVQRR